MEAVVAPLFQAKLYPAVPPVAEAVAPPSLPPLQLTLLSTRAEETSSVGSVMVTEEESVHPLASVMVTE
jgi:hypothetical protein